MKHKELILVFALVIPILIAPASVLSREFKVKCSSDLRLSEIRSDEESLALDEALSELYCDITATMYRIHGLSGRLFHDNGYDYAFMRPFTEPSSESESESETAQDGMSALDTRQLYGVVSGMYAPEGDMKNEHKAVTDPSYSELDQELVRERISLMQSTLQDFERKEPGVLEYNKPTLGLHHWTLDNKIRFQIYRSGQAVLSICNPGFDLEERLNDLLSYRNLDPGKPDKVDRIQALADYFFKLLPAVLNSITRIDAERARIEFGADALWNTSMINGDVLRLRGDLVFLKAELLRLADNSDDPATALVYETKGLNHWRLDDGFYYPVFRATENLEQACVDYEKKGFKVPFRRVLDYIKRNITGVVGYDLVRPDKEKRNRALDRLHFEYIPEAVEMLEQLISELNLVMYGEDYREEQEPDAAESNRDNEEDFHLLGVSSNS